MPKAPHRLAATVRSEVTMNNYDDIINLPYNGSASGKKMDMAARAAQFAPFAAISGHDAAISETSRITSCRVELSTDEQSILSQRLQYALAHLASHHSLSFTVFVQDLQKSGGRYVTAPGVIKKFDEGQNSLVLLDGTVIHIPDIISINGEIFNHMYI